MRRVASLSGSNLPTLLAVVVLLTVASVAVAAPDKAVGQGHTTA